MEFPELGSNCFQSDCNQLDFLPVKCDACGNKFCSQHWQYQAHSCPNSHVRNVQVPVCPLCDQPVPTARGVVPDIAVSAHIDRDCKSDPAVKKRIYTNRCSMKSCKQKELIKICCDNCGLNYCLKHRHPQDHKCTGKSGAGAMNRAGLAALSRHQQQQKQPQPAPKQQQQRQQPPPQPSARSAASALQGGVSEEEALRRALEASMREAGPEQGAAMSQEEQDRQLAEAIARSEREAAAAAQQRPRQQTVSDGSNCQIS